MNIFALSKCPKESAKQMLDKHIVKMPTETCQMLHTNALYFQFVELHDKEPSLRELKAFHKEIGSKLMKPAMLNHPSTIWARQSYANFDWLYQHGIALCEEYTYRYGKEHGSETRIKNTPFSDYLQLMRVQYDIGLTPVSIAMDDMYRIENTFDDEWEFVIQSYRHYYLEGKWRFAEWRNNRRPEWWPVNHINIKWNEVFTRMNEQNNFSIPLKMLPLEAE